MRYTLTELLHDEVQLLKRFVGFFQSLTSAASLHAMWSFLMSILFRGTLVGLCFCVAGTAVADEPIRFGRDVLPILSANCYACHGPDQSERKAGLRLDQESEAKAEHDSGATIVAGDPLASVVFQRITSGDPDAIMPPPDSHRQLTAAQIDILRRWIEQGAVWGRHWSFEPVQRLGHPAAAQSSLDAVVSESLARNGLTLRPSAPPHQLVRRVSLDLIGLPPTPELADRFAADPGEAAYEALIDQLLASPHFGEHWARLWMDLARYADTKGYEKDLGRSVWPYRDWLVSAINNDRPLDQMTIEQLAGDLLPDPTQDQLIATTFHRNTMSNDEGGTDDEEFRTIAVKDRVDTTMQVWMGLTAGCAKCHTHKYDPISQAEYYGLYAIFNQTQDADRYDDSPTLEVLPESLRAERDAVKQAIAALKLRQEEADVAVRKLDDQRWQTGATQEASSSSGAALKIRADGSILVSGTKAVEDVYVVTLKLSPGRQTALRIEALPEKSADGQLGVGRNPKDPNFVLSELEVDLHNQSEKRRIPLIDPRADFAQESWPVDAAIDGDLKTGWAVSPRQRERHVAVFAFSEALQTEPDATLTVTLRQHYGDSLTLRGFRISVTQGDLAEMKLSAVSPEQRQVIDELAAAHAKLQSIQSNVARVPVMSSVTADKRRTTKIHLRGNFLDPGDEITAGVPLAFHQLADEQAPDRLALAKWLMSRENSLTPRVWANRIWARLFGIGIVETEEDFGALGALPTQPELLDWLAAEYRDNGWSLKKFLKTIVMSRAYRQSSEITEELREADPLNERISRGARFRLSAESVRDQALFVSGLLSTKLGGPPVMPPQPAGLWRSTYNGQKWVTAEGDDRFRRGLYTYLKRTTPYPSMTTFDGGSGEVCQVRRIRTNTPLQALVTLNDPVFWEAAGALARRMADFEGSPHQKAEYGLRQALIRPLRDGESSPLELLQRDAAAALLAAPMKAKSLIETTRTMPPDGVTDPEFAGWIVVANTILNLDELLTRN